MPHKKQKLTIAQVFNMFPNDEAAEQWFIEQIYPNGVHCPSCGSLDASEGRNARGKRRFRCRSCRTDFTTKTGSVMEGSNLGYRTWAIAIFLLSTNIKGIASTKLASDLGITQKSAWHLAHRIRKAYYRGNRILKGIVEVDETYIGGKERNKHASKKLHAGRGAVGKQAVMGMRERGSRKVVAMPVANTTRMTLHGEIHANVESGSVICTDDHRGYWGIGGGKYKHEAVKHSVSEYVREMAHTNGIESFWALLKRGYHGTHHHMSHKHLWRYVNEFSERYGLRETDTADAMKFVAKSMVGKRLRYKELTAQEGNEQ